MYVDYTDEQKALRTELRAYYEKLITPEIRREMRAMEISTVSRDLIRKMGADGWLGVGWPVEWGGQGRTGIEQQIWFEETRRAGAPLPFVTINTVGPALIARGSEAQKDLYLRKILAGEIQFAIGYTEPESGTDLATLKTSAVRDGDHYVVNGTKIFTSGADGADYIWLACRTDPEAPKHRGISILIVDTQSDGFSWSPIETLGGGKTTMTYYENVRVPVENLVGPENGGWKLITLQLNHERMGLAAFGGMAGVVFEEVIAWARATENEQGTAVVDIPWVQLALGEAHARLAAIRVMNWRMAVDLEQGLLDPARASAAKAHGTETVIEVYRLLLEIVGEVGTIAADSPGAILLGRLEREWRGCQINTFGGGVNEIQREIVAMLGLGMPRAPR